MILNHSEYESDKSTLEDSKNSIKALKSKKGIGELQRERNLAGIRHWQVNLRKRITEYEELLSRKVTFDSEYHIDDLVPILPKIRIASGMTQREVSDLARINELKFRQYEDSEYFGAKRSEILKVAKVLGVKVMNQRDNSKLPNYGVEVEECVKKLLTESDTPLHFRKIAKFASERIGKRISFKLAHDVAAKVGQKFDYGLYGFAKHLPLSKREMASVVAEVETLMSSKPKKNFWEASEILKSLSKGMKDVAEKLNEHTLDVVLKDAGNLQYLGRMTWKLSEPNCKQTERIKFRDKIIAELKSAKRPMTTKELVILITKGANQCGTIRIEPDGDLTRLKKGLWGLKGWDNEKRLVHKSDASQAAG